MYKKFLFPALFVLTVWFFTKGIAVDVYERNSTLLTLIAAILSTGLLAVSLFHIFPAKTAGDEEKAGVRDDLGCFLMIIIAAWFIGFSVFLIYKSSGDTTNELKEHGIYTIGTVVDGSSFKTRRIDMTSISIKYQTKEGKTIVAKAEVSSGRFNNYYKGQQVQIVYSTLHPLLIGIIAGDGDVQRYTGVNVREVRLDDLYKILDLKKGKPIEDYLNTISQKWEYEEGIEGEAYYKNTLKDIAIKTFPEGSVSYVESFKGANLFEHDLFKKGIKPQEDGLIKMYTDGNYIILSERKKTSENRMQQNGMPNFVTVITVMKTK